MPIAMIHMIEGRSAEKKRALIERVSHAIAESLDAPLDSVRVLITEVPADLWGIGGTPAADRGR